MCVPFSFWCTFYFPVAIDSVEINSDPDRALYTNETVTVTCSVLLSASVDTAVDVSVVWSGPQGDILSTSERVTVSEVTDAAPYQSTLALSSLTTSDTGLYNCTATADPRDSPFATASNEQSATQCVTVGKFGVCKVLLCEIMLLPGTADTQRSTTSPSPPRLTQLLVRATL